MVDLVIISWSFALSYFILKHFEFKGIYRGHFFLYSGLYVSISFTVFYYMRIHTGLIRYSNMQDIFRIFLAVALSSLLYPLSLKFFLLNIYHIDSLDVPKVLLINFFISSSLLIMLRAAVKESFYYAKRIASSNCEKILIYGTDSSAVLIKQALESSSLDGLQILGFVDINNHKAYTYIEQRKVFPVNDLYQLKKDGLVDKLIMMNQELGNEEKKSVINLCLQFGIKVVTVPPSNEWIYGKLSAGQMKNLKIEDLLQREPIVINDSSIGEELKDKSILITGAAGSIGSEIVRQVLKYEPDTVILCDQAESALHEMQLEIEEKFPEADLKIFIGSIQNRKRMEILFDRYRPQIVFHAAAYKHVPMMEHNPTEAVLANVMGTKNIADLAVLYEAEKFVMISTDKAVKPTNVMGASKRIAEIYIQSLNDSAKEDIFTLFDKKTFKLDPENLINRKTKFITTRFGNVLDSNGSVIPRFRLQIENGGPITVTHPEITRYFMTIPEAVRLVLEAGTVGKGGEVYVFDMGKPVKISNLAMKMIKLAGLTPEKDIKIVYTGLRPGEKLYEELLNEKETTLPTHHEKIKIARVIAHPYEKILHDVEELILMSDYEDEYMLVKKMKEIVPQFISNNSIFEQLDKINTEPKIISDNFSKFQSDQKRNKQPILKSV